MLLECVQLEFPLLVEAVEAAALACLARAHAQNLDAAPSSTSGCGFLCLGERQVLAFLVGAAAHIVLCLRSGVLAFSM